MSLVVDTRARASCGDYGHFAELSLESVTVDGVVQPATSATAVLRGTVHYFDNAPNEPVYGAALVRGDRPWEFYEPITP